MEIDNCFHKYAAICIYSFLLGIFVIMFFFSFKENLNNIPISNNISGPDSSGLRLEVYNNINKTFEKFNRSYDWIKIGAGQSMNPSIIAGNDVLCYIDFTEKELAIGNIIVYTLDKETLIEKGIDTGFTYGVHRIIDIKIRNGVKYYVAKGDNNNIKDPLEITKEDINCVVGGVLYNSENK